MTDFRIHPQDPAPDGFAIVPALVLLAAYPPEAVLTALALAMALGILRALKTLMGDYAGRSLLGRRGDLHRLVKSQGQQEADHARQGRHIRPDPLAWEANHLRHAGAAGDDAGVAGDGIPALGAGLGTQVLILARLQFAREVGRLTLQTAHDLAHGLRRVRLRGPDLVNPDVDFAPV
jgi:hypothetical protein